MVAFVKSNRADSVAAKVGVAGKGLPGAAGLGKCELLTLEPRATHIPAANFALKNETTMV